MNLHFNNLQPYSSFKAAVVNAAVAFGCQEEHLRFSAIRREGPAMSENDRLPKSQVFSINLGAVFSVIMLRC